MENLIDPAELLDLVEKAELNSDNFTLYYSGEVFNILNWKAALDLNKAIKSVLSGDTGPLKKLAGGGK